jgi:hypothetical protein
VPIVARGNGDVVVIERFTGSVNEPEAVLLALSVTFTVKVVVTAVEGGVPERTPAALMLSHAGWPVTLHVYPVPEPPVAAKVWL